LHLCSYCSQILYREERKLKRRIPENRDKTKAYNKAYREKNQEKLSASNKKYREENYVELWFNDKYMTGTATQNPTQPTQSELPTSLPGFLKGVNPVTPVNLTGDNPNPAGPTDKTIPTPT
jgi:hypothetical protein